MPQGINARGDLGGKCRHFRFDLHLDAFESCLQQKEKTTEWWSFLFVHGVQKRYFCVFAYEFEILHNRSFLVKSFAYAHGEIIYSVNCEI